MYRRLHVHLFKTGYSFRPHIIPSKMNQGPGLVHMLTPLSAENLNVTTENPSSARKMFQATRSRTVSRKSTCKCRTLPATEIFRKLPAASRLARSAASSFIVRDDKSRAEKMKFQNNRGLRHVVEGRGISHHRVKDSSFAIEGLAWVLRFISGC